jgi:hypothetical protein
MASASLSGISMLNSWSSVRERVPHGPNVATNLFNSHNHLYRIETVETKIVVEVRFGVELSVYVSTHFLNSHEAFVIPLKYPGPATGLANSSDFVAPHPHLVKVLQQVHYPASNLILRQTSTCGVASHGLEVCGGGDLLWLEERASRDRASHCGLASWCSAGS